MAVRLVKEVLDKIYFAVSDQGILEGVLLGYKDAKTFIITECVNAAALEKFTSTESTFDTIESFFPGGISICGVFTVAGNNSESENTLKSRKNEYLTFEIDVTDKSKWKCQKIGEDRNSMDIEVKMVSKSEGLKYLADNTIVFNIEHSVMILIQDFNLKTIQEKFLDEITKLSKKLKSDQMILCLSVEKKLVINGERVSVLDFLSLNDKERLKAFQGVSFYSSRQFLTDKFIQKMEMYENISMGIGDCFVPVLKSTSIKKVRRFALRFSTIAHVDKSSQLSDLDQVLKSALIRQLTNMKLILSQCFGSMNKITGFEISHFCLPNSCHSIDVCLPGGEVVEKASSYRKNFLHPFFMESSDMPLFTSLNNVKVGCKNGIVLLNTHEGLKAPNVDDGVMSLVRGLYGYHHYMQDRFDDNGWGCAYRSCQTIVSWFRYQGYTDIPVPSHKEIQQALVAVGDKPKEFTGSKLWIGSIEINNVLSHLLGVTSKIMFVSRGSELGSKGRELAAHFKEQGTPVMIGGGVLAHTILGVCFSEVTGETKFLILDPHYTGTEDLKIIQTKGWCGWKSNDFWDQNAYYNLCLPQRPDVC